MKHIAAFGETTSHSVTSLGGNRVGERQVAPRSGFWGAGIAIRCVVSVLSGTHLLPWGRHTIMELEFWALPVETAAGATTGAIAAMQAILIRLFGFTGRVCEGVR